MAREAGATRTTVSAFWTWVVLVWAMAAVASGSWGVGNDGDDSDCSKSMEALSECIPYGSGQVASPSPECCEGTLAVSQWNPGCLCMALRSSGDPSSHAPVSLAIALKIPIVCNVDGVDVAKCPSILSLPPDSSDAQFFERINATATAPANQPHRLSPSVSAGRRLEWFSWAITMAPLVVSLTYGPC